jgi:type IV pilus assembly protein PilA
MELINRIRKSRKGFTLVEIIVVLVILAILAAFTIPTMLGFVNEARGKALIAEARSVYLAAQATATEYKGTNQTFDAAALGSPAVGAASPAGASLTMKNYLDDDMDISNAAIDAVLSATVPATGDSYWTVTLTGGKVDTVVYTKNGYQITIDKTDDAKGAIVEKL